MVDRFCYQIRFSLFLSLVDCALLKADRMVFPDRGSFCRAFLAIIEFINGHIMSAHWTGIP